jgi:anti-anti-sigma factor
MEIEERQVDDVTILHLKGRLLIGPDGNELLRQKFDSLVEAGRTKIALDLGGVPYCDSAGLGEIVRCYKTLSRKDGKFKLLNIPKRIYELLSVARLLVVVGDDDEDWPT